MKHDIRTLFISDVHLGNPNAQAEILLDVIKSYNFENLIIIGDFFDLTKMSRKFYWKQSHTNVVQKILKLSKKKNVIYILGNHDYFLRELITDTNIYIGSILLCNDYQYTTLKKEKIYITHGDCFDGFVKVSPFLYWLGDNAYEFSVSINRLYNFFRQLFGLNYWSLSAYLKDKVKNIVGFLSKYEKNAISILNEKNCDSILMGHIHTPKISKIGKYNYYNTGDFVESCSYMIEDLNGDIKLKLM